MIHVVSSVFYKLSHINFREVHWNLPKFKVRKAKYFSHIVSFHITWWQLDIAEKSNSIEEEILHIVNFEHFTPCSSVSNVSFEQVNAGWV